MTNDKRNPIDPVLIVDDDKPFTELIERDLNLKSINHVKVCQDGSALNSKEEIDKYSFILLNISMPSIKGKEAAIKILEEHPKIPVIFISTDGSLNDAVKYMKQGALYYYIKKKIDHSKLIDQICQGVRLYESIKPIITVSKKMRLIFSEIGRIAPTNVHVFIRGGTGVGKELVAEAIHNMSHRKITGEYVRVNIACFDRNLFANEIFGHTKGAYTTAGASHDGFLKKANTGTLFLDEIGDLESESQTKLLRLLEDGTYFRLGSTEEVKSDSRIIVATNKNIEEDMRLEKFRADFFQRLKKFTITIPPLRERKEDIPLLVDHFIKKTSIKHNLNKPIPDKEFIQSLICHDFKGNIRELEGLIEGLVIRFHCLEKLTSEMLEEYLEKGFVKTDPTFIQDQIQPDTQVSNPELGIPTFIEVEASYYQELLSRTDGDQTKAAKMADLERRTFNNRLKAIEGKLQEKGKNFNGILPLTELVKQFPPKNGNIKN